MTRAQCERAAVLVPGYLDGELSEEQAAPLRRHLLSCPECRHAAQDLTNLRRWFPAQAAPAAPAGFAARVARAAFAGVEPGHGASTPGAAAASPPASSSSSEVLPFLLTMTSAAAVALLVFALLLGDERQPSGEQLVAEPLPAILHELDELNAMDRPGVPLDERGERP